MFRRTRFNYLATTGLDEHEINALATFNAEKARGLVHTVSYAEAMAALQRRYNAVALKK